MDYIHIYHSPMGDLTLASDGEHLVGLWFDGDRHYESVLSDEYERRDDLPAFQLADAWLITYFSGNVPSFTPPILVRGSAFRQEVCWMLLEIPYGETTTYGEIARQIAAKRGITRMSPQAVGGAVGHNPISIIIPCHRVIGSDGSLTGYGGGLERKEALLVLEQKVRDHSWF